MSLHKTMAALLGVCVAGLVLWLSFNIGANPSLVDDVRRGHIENIPSMAVGELVTIVSRKTAIWTIDNTGQLPLVAAWWTAPDKKRIRLEFSMPPRGTPGKSPVVLDRVLVDDVDQGWMVKGRYLDVFTRLSRGESLEQAFAR